MLTARDLGSKKNRRFSVHRLGAKATALTAAGILLTGSAVILFGPGGQPGLWRWTGFIVAVLVAGAAATIATATRRRECSA